MTLYAVTVRTADKRYAYHALGHSSIAVHLAALDRFGGLCSVIVKPA